MITSFLKKIFDKSKSKEKKKKVEKNNKNMGVKTVFNEAVMNNNYFSASKEATIGREIMFDTVKESINRNIESAKGFHFEAHQVNSVNIKAAKAGIEGRKVMHGSKKSSEYRSVESDPHSPMDVSTVIDGKIIKGTGAQMKGSNKAWKKDGEGASNGAYEALKDDIEKYTGMEKVVVEGQANKIKEVALTEGKTEIADTITETVSIKSETTGKEVFADSTPLDLIKNRNSLKIDAVKTEIVTSLESAALSGIQAGAVAVALKTIDDIVENRKIEYNDLLNTGAETAISVAEYTLVKDVIVNKMKLIGSKGFINVAVGLGMASDIKRLAEMSFNGTDSYTIADETTATMVRMGATFASKALLGIPGCGPAASVVVGYVGSKIIQQFFYNETKMQLRTLREDNNSNDKILQMLKQREINLEVEIERFLNEVQNTCNERLNIINKAFILNTEEGYMIASEVLTNKKINRTTDIEIEAVFSKGLKI